MQLVCLQNRCSNVAELAYAITTHDAEIVNLKAMIATLDAKVSAMQK